MIDLLLFVFLNLVSDLGRAAVEVSQLVLWLMGFVECIFHKSLRKFFSSLKWRFVLRFQEWGIPLSTIINGIFWNRASDDVGHGAKFFSLYGPSWGWLGKIKLQSRSWSENESPGRFSTPKLLINRVFRGLNIFLSTRQSILSPFVIWTLRCSLQTFVPRTQDCKFLVSQFLTSLQFLISLLQFLISLLGKFLAPSFNNLAGISLEEGQWL